MRLSLVEPLAPSFCWDGEALVDPETLAPPAAPPADARGAFTAVIACADSQTIVRDPIGLGKVFFAERDGEILLAGRPIALTRLGIRLDDCWSFPPGTIAHWSGGAVRVEILGRGLGDGAGHDTDAVAVAIRTGVQQFIRAVLDARPGRAVVCLSGGLDSAVVAALVRAHREDALVVCFDLDGKPSDDRRGATRLARELGLELLPAVWSARAVLARLDEVLMAGVDWRDFNVHAALVNASLAATLVDALGDDAGDATVFTGDLANE